MSTIANEKDHLMVVRLEKIKSTIRRLAEDTSGNELMEAAAIFPLLFMVFLGIFWAGQAFNMYGTITRAAQEGARAGAAPYCSTCSTANLTPQLARAAVKNAMAAARLDIGNAQYPPTQPTFTSCNGTPTGCDATATNVCVQWPVQITTPTAGNPGVCGVAVSFQYPFQTYLPFTSINQTKIWLNAQARVRIETQ